MAISSLAKAALCKLGVTPEVGKDITSWLAYGTGYLGFGGSRYQTYDSAVTATYHKYNLSDSCGVATLITVVNLLSAFISGDGVSVSFDPEDEIDKERQRNFVGWKKDFYTFNNEPNGYFTSLIKKAVKSGKLLVSLKVVEKRGVKNVKIIPIPYNGRKKYTVTLKGVDIGEGFTVKLDNQKFGEQKDLDSKKDNLFYVVIGSDDDVNKTPYKYHGCLSEIENYDRAIKDMRRLNYCGARVTPTFRVAQKGEANELTAKLKKSGWSMGKIFVGTAEFKYETPANTSSMDALLREAEINAQTISAITSIPVHWLGFTNLMSNRATADTLYDMMITGTKDERNAMADFFHDIILKAQEMYMDEALGANNKKLDKLEKEITVKIPVIDNSRFESIVKGLKIAKGDGAISTVTYQQSLPGVDPVTENLRLDQESMKKDVDESLNNKVIRQEISRDDDDILDFMED